MRFNQRFPSFRKALEAFAPRLWDCLRSLRHWRYFSRRFGAFQKKARGEIYPKDAPLVVLSGPFRGMSYLHETVWGSITPKWLGSYECELHPVLEQIFQENYGSILDVGSAEGYYAVGLALKFPSAVVHAFDTDFRSRLQVRRLARLNRVEERVVVKARCEYPDLSLSRKGKTLLICDIEGYEAELLAPEQAPSLREMDILVEVHEGSQSGKPVEELLCSRFAASHRLERIEAVDRQAWIAEAASIFAGLPPEFLRAATEEHRLDGRCWLWLRANSSALSLENQHGPAHQQTHAADGGNCS
jgi:hypothetical protein